MVRMYSTKQGCTARSVMLLFSMESLVTALDQRMATGAAYMSLTCLILQEV